MTTLVERNLDYTLYDWVPQTAISPLPIERAEGIYLYDTDGKRYIDWSSQLVNVNIGHSHPRVIEAIKAQADKLLYVHPHMATDIRAEVGQKLAEIAPGTLKKSLFTLGGTESIEHAIRIARLYTGRNKIVTRYRSYHGATAGAASAGGDPRRLGAEPGMTGIVRVHDPYRYRCLFCRDLQQCNLVCEEHIEQTIFFEGPENVAAVMLEGWNGSSGIIQSPRNREYFQRLRAFCDEHGILIIADEVMSGFGRTGKWFGIEHGDIEPDIMAVAKGLTSAYLPLGATIVSEAIGEHFDRNTLWAGLTYNAHPMSLAAASACIDVYKDENLVENSARMGVVLERELAGLQEKHPSLGEYRGIGLFYAIELVKNRVTREPLSPFNKPFTEPMRRLASYLRENGMFTMVRWNWIFCAPPLIIREEQIREGIEILSGALAITDEYYEGA